MIKNLLISILYLQNSILSRKSYMYGKTLSSDDEYLTFEDTKVNGNDENDKNLMKNIVDGKTDDRLTLADLLELGDSKSPAENIFDQRSFLNSNFPEDDNLSESVEYESNWLKENMNLDELMNIPSENDFIAMAQNDLNAFSSMNQFGARSSKQATSFEPNAPSFRKFRYEFMMAYWMKYEASLVHLSKNWYEFTQKITNYGCFCFNEQTTTNGKGSARDLIDQTCKNLHKCQTCIDMDIMNGDLQPNVDGTCSPYSLYSFNLTRIDKKPHIECLNLENTCQRALCECDKKFASELALNYDTWNPTLKGKNAFNRESQCTSVGMAHMGAVDTCCGEYPNRFPFHGQEGMKQCCGTKTYETYGPLQCCRGNVLKEVC